MSLPSISPSSIAFITVLCLRMSSKCFTCLLYFYLCQRLSFHFCDPLYLSACVFVKYDLFFGVSEPQFYLLIVCSLSRFPHHILTLYLTTTLYIQYIKTKQNKNKSMTCSICFVATCGYIFDEVQGCNSVCQAMPRLTTAMLQFLTLGK